MPVKLLRVFGDEKLTHTIRVQGGPVAPVAQIDTPCEVADLTREQIKQINQAYFNYLKEFCRPDHMQYYNWTEADKRRRENG